MIKSIGIKENVWKMNGVFLVIGRDQSFRSKHTFMNGSPPAVRLGHQSGEKKILDIGLDKMGLLLEQNSPKIHRQRQ